MNLFAFSSGTLTNIWAGIGARRWAVSQRDDAAMRGLITKARAMKVGSAGVLYCSETKSLTVPFLVYSEPDPTEVVDNIWPESWVLPFAIHPLGTPRRQLHMHDAMATVPVLRASGSTNISHVLRIAPTTAFVPKEVSDEDWAVLLTALAD